MAKLDITILWAGKDRITIFLGDENIGSGDDGDGHCVSQLFELVSNLESKDIEFGRIREADLDWDKTAGVTYKLSDMEPGSVVYR